MAAVCALLAILLAAFAPLRCASSHGFTEFNIMVREKVSLGMHLSQDLHVLSFATRSIAEVRGVKAGDRLIAVNDNKLLDGEASDITSNARSSGLSRLSSILRTLAWPRTFTFRRIVQGGATEPIASSSDNSYNSNAKTETSSKIDDDFDSAAFQSKRRQLPIGKDAQEFSVVFPRNERIGLHFGANLTVIGFARGSDGSIRAAERSGMIQRGDALISANGDANAIEALLEEPWPALSVIKYLQYLQPPVVLRFVRRVRTQRVGTAYRKSGGDFEGSVDDVSGTVRTDLEDWRKHHLGHYVDDETLEEVHNGEHIDIALLGSHHSHDAGDYSHHTVNAYRIARAEFGPDPSCDRQRLVAANPLHACGDLQQANSLKGAYAVVIRGHCNFIDKARAVEAEGAVGMILINTGGSKLVRMPGALFGMSDDSNDVSIPSVMVDASAYELIAQELDTNQPDTLYSRKWTGRIVGPGGCLHGGSRSTRTDASESGNRNKGTTSSSNDVKPSGGYIVGHDGQPIYRERRSLGVDKEVVVIKAGVVIFMPPTGDMSLQSLPVEVEYMLADFGGVSVPEFSSATFISADDSCKEGMDQMPTPCILLVPLDGGSCSLLQKVILAERRGAEAVMFLSSGKMLRPLASPEKASDAGIEIPVMSTTIGDAQRIEIAISKWSRAQLPIHTHAWENSMIEHAWATYETLQDYSAWPRDAWARRRLVHRLLRSAGKSLPQREAIVDAASRAEAFFGRAPREEL